MPRPRFRNLRAATAIVAASVMVLGAACGSGGTPVVQSPTSTFSPSPTPTAIATTPSTASPSASLSCAEVVLDHMTEVQRVGQLFMVGLSQDDTLDIVTEAAIGSRHLGSVTFIATTTAGVDAVRAVTDAVQALATDSATAGVGFFVAANQEGGLIQALQGPGFSRIPSAADQGKLDPTVLQTDAAKWGTQLVAAGVNFDLAPVMDVVPPGEDDTNQPIGVLHRGFGNDPQTVGAHGVAFLIGMQQSGVATSAKHFPGLGRVVGNTDFTADVVDDVTTANDPYLGSFRAAIDAGSPFVMVALATYTKIDPDNLAVFSPTVMGILRDAMGFNGVIVSDDIGNAEAISDIPPGTRAIDFLEAGGDLIISKTVAPAVSMAEAVSARADSDAAFRSIVDDAALRILQAKEAYGLLPCGD
jgi:beta-N-acetylhexosaminidase